MARTPAGISNILFPSFSSFNGTGAILIKHYFYHYDINKVAKNTYYFFNVLKGQ